MKSEYATIRVFRTDRDRLAKLRKLTGQILIGGNGQPFSEPESVAKIFERVLVEYEILTRKNPPKNS